MEQAFLDPFHGFLFQAGDQIYHTGVYKFQTAEFFDVCIDHHGIHPSGSAGNFHDPGNLLRQENNTGVHQIIAGFLLIFIAPFPKMLKALVRKGLFLKACGVKGVLNPYIQHEPLHNIVIGIVQQLLDDACPDHDIYGSVRSAVVFVIKDTEWFFFNLWEKFISEYFRL